MLQFRYAPFQLDSIMLGSIMNTRWSLLPKKKSQHKSEKSRKYIWGRMGEQGRNKNKCISIPGENI